MAQDTVLLISGSRDWSDLAPIRDLLLLFDPFWTLVIHGGARGADRIAGTLAKAMGFYVIPFYADWKRDNRGNYDAGAGPRRNRVMWDFCIANQRHGVAVHAGIFPLPQSVGTLDMYGLCQLGGFDIHVPEACKAYL